MKRFCEVSLGLRGSVIVLIPMLTMMAAAPAQEFSPTTSDDGNRWYVEQPAEDADLPDDDAFGDDDLNRALENDDRDRRGDDEQGDSRRDPNVFRRFWPRWRPTDEHERNHRAVREAFRDVVKEANQSTVQVYSGGRRVAFGTIIDANGLVLTKASELREAVECRLCDGRKFAAQLLTVNDDLDVAVLRIPAKDLKAIHWREEDTPPAGSWLATVGSGELPTAVGVVSAAPRAIPMPQPVLGVELEETDFGPRIKNIIPESPAEDAGLKEKDVVLEVNGKSVSKRQELIDTIRGMRPGDGVDLLIQRDSEKMSIRATLTEINSLAQGRRVDFQNSLGGPLSPRRWGFPSVLQHDTVLRPSDCGGPVVDLAGNAVGVNIARAGRVASYALPVSALAPVLDEVRKGTFAPVEVETAAVSAEMN